MWEFNYVDYQVHMSTEEQIATVVIDENGHIEDMDDPGHEILGAISDTTESRHITTLIPSLSKFIIFRKGEVNPRLKYLIHIGQSFQVLKLNGGCVLCRLCLNVIERSGKRLVRIILRPEKRRHIRAS